VDKSNKEKNQEFLDKLVAHLRAQQEKPTTVVTNGRGGSRPVGEPTDEEVLEKCRAAKNAATPPRTSRSSAC
jgi:hypothetical protein